MLMFDTEIARWLSVRQPPLWEIELRDRERSDENMFCVDASHAELELVATNRWLWQHIPVADQPDVLDVTVWRDEAGCHLSVQNHSETHGIWRVNFPQVAIHIDPQTRFVLPMGWGVEFQASSLEPFHGDYPNGACPMQWLCAHKGSQSVYLAAYDGEGYHKGIHAVPDADALAVSFSHFPEDPGIPGGDYTLPYPIAIETLDGDWMVAAKRYRSWTEQSAIWMRDTDTYRNQEPTWLQGIPLWCLASGSPEEVVPAVKRFADYFGVLTAVHWYNWHQIPFDTEYPEYFPTKPGFREGVRQLQDAGIRVMPYINARLFDASTDSWKQEGAERFCALSASGQPYTEVYGSSPPLTPMCPATDYWQDKVKRIVETLVGEYRVDGVYLDQIASAGVRPCFNETHGHPVGSGRFWVQGYRKMLRAIRESIHAIAPESILTTEDAAEPYIGLLDAYLMCNRTRSEQIPAYSAVYGASALTFGRYLFAEDARESLPFITKCAEQFVFGAQMGWLGPWILDYPAEAAYLKALAQVRHEAQKFLGFGELIAIPTIDGAIPRLETVWRLWGREEQIVMRAVQGSLWCAPDGEQALVLTNVHKHTLRFTWAIPGSESPTEEELPGRSAVLRVLTQEGSPR